MCRNGCDIFKCELNLETRQYNEENDMKLGPGLTFSWKRATGVTTQMRRVSKKTGVPLTRNGRRSKVGRWLGMK
jgi:hypothetical protein